MAEFWKGADGNYYMKAAPNESTIPVPPEKLEDVRDAIETAACGGKVNLEWGGQFAVKDRGRTDVAIYSGTIGNKVISREEALNLVKHMDGHAEEVGKRELERREGYKKIAGR